MRAARQMPSKKVKKGSGERKEVQLVLPGRFPMGEVGNSYNIFERAGETFSPRALHAVRWPGLGGREKKFVVAALSGLHAGWFYSSRSQN